MRKDMAHFQWWRTAATHMFRMYYRYQADGLTPDTKAKQKACFLVECVLSEASDYERKFLPKYFACSWGQDVQFVENYSQRSGISTTTLWRSVHDANRRLFELAGLLDPKEK